MTKPVSVIVSSGVAVSAKSTSKTPGDHVAVFNLAADGGTNNAGLNVVSANTAFSACEVSGHEAGHGTLKISHVNPGPNPASDANAAAISIDLQAGRPHRAVFACAPVAMCSGDRGQVAPRVNLLADPLINCFQLPRRRPLPPPEGGTHHDLRQGMHELRG